MQHTVRITVETARPEDFSRIGEIGVAAYAGVQLLSDEYAAVLRDVARRAAETVVLVARAGGEVLGSLTLAAAGGPYADLARDEELEVRMLAVDPTAQRRGVAEVLLRAAAEWAQEHGYPALVLSVVTTDGPRTPHRLYERLGYRRDPARDYVGYWEGHPQMWFYELAL
ncbi:GNAT family N-acetyltransferase [Georgenia subflava]|uniref:GNAT family N-acetyltransferase n=1 Tax=Georgenia subflava TaxID=1622177 RepID=A0A6N7EIR3_9MICO|nr:GNAT family N-acetyltransferase [Georgenia subflava]MPV38272.1 GNAT family N-acetyltransferase [Georgenia subflava]